MKKNQNNTFKINEAGIALGILDKANSITILSDLKQSHYNKLADQDEKYRDDINWIVYYASTLKNVVEQYLANNTTIVTTSEDVFVIAAAKEYLERSEVGSLVVLDARPLNCVYKDLRFDMNRVKWIEMSSLESIPPSIYTSENNKHKEERKVFTDKIKELQDEQGDSDANADEISELRERRRELGNLVTDKFLMTSTLARMAVGLTGNLCLLRINNKVDELNKLACADVINKSYPNMVYSLTESAQAGEYITRTLLEDEDAIKSIRSSINSTISDKVIDKVKAPLLEVKHMLYGMESSEAGEEELEVYLTSPEVKALKNKKKSKSSKKVFTPFNTLLRPAQYQVDATLSKDILNQPLRLVISMGTDEEDEDIEVDLDQDRVAPTLLFEDTSLEEVLERKISSFLEHNCAVATYVNESKGYTDEATKILYRLLEEGQAQGKDYKGIVFYSDDYVRENSKKEDYELPEILQEVSDNVNVIQVDPLVMSKMYIGETEDKLGNKVPNSFSEFNIECAVLAELCDSVTINTTSNKSSVDLFNMFTMKDKMAGVTKRGKSGVFEPVRSTTTKAKLVERTNVEPTVYMNTLNMYPKAMETLTRETCIKVFDAEYLSESSGDIPTRTELNPNGIKVAEKVEPEKKEKAKKGKSQKGKTKKKIDVKAFGV